MSERWPGGIVRSTPVTPTGPLQNGTAPGIWTMEQAAYWTKQGLWPTAGNFLAVEDVFSTWLYTGTGSAQTITNGIDLAGKGGLVWIKSRSSTVYHNLVDTARGNTSYIYSNASDQADVLSTRVTSFNSDGFTLGPTVGTNPLSNSGVTYASWTFREAPKFFDVVTYTGNGSLTTGQNITHALGSVPGFIIIKATSTTSNWFVYHRGTGAPSGAVTGFQLNASSAANYPTASSANITSTTFNPTSVIDTLDNVPNLNGVTYVAYLFAHDTTSDGIIQCGSYTGAGGIPVNVTLGWEPQWLLVKRASGGANDWILMDVMRGMSQTDAAWLYPNTSGIEDTGLGQQCAPTATGFTIRSTGTNLNGSGTYIYIAIRRGPMRTPTSGTSVFSPVAQTSTANQLVSTGFPVDLLIERSRASTSDTWVFDRLRGSQSTSAVTLSTSSTNAESNTSPYGFGFDRNNGVTDNWGYGSSTIYWNFRRAPSFFDEVCYTGTGTNGQAYSHNLGVTPELVIIKRRNATGYWPTWYTSFGTGQSFLYLNVTDALADQGVSLMTASPTASQFTLSGSNTWWNSSGSTYVAYLFASCPGVSKVGSYTGTGALQTINCGFTTGARFVLIKRTDSTGDWFVWDSARGITSGNDPYLLMNSTAAEVTSTNYVDTDTTGFKVTAAAPAALNANGGTYIFLAIS